MEFWGVEVKPGESLPVCPEEGQLVHISQVALGEVKNVKAANYVPVHLTVDGKKFVIGTLSAERGPQISFDLVLEKEFELSHDWKDGSLYFCGYTADDQEDGPVDHEGFSDEDGEEQESSEEEEEEEHLNAKPVAAPQAPKPANAKAAAKSSDSKAAAKPKPKVTLIDPKDEKDESDESDDSDDDESDGDDLEDDSDDDMSEDEETPQKSPPKKAEASKKRPAESEVKTPASSKKSKNETPLKTDGKKGNVHTATPHPAKKSEKKTAESHPAKKSEKKTAESPKSSALVCKSCSRTFTSEKGLESHTMAKHAGK